MFYRADEPHGLAHNPFKAIVAPRPIGWISTLSAQGVANLAPYSFFNAVSDTPMMVMFSSGGMKDTLTHARDTGEFTFNFVTAAMKDAMNVSSGPHAPDVSEFDLAGVAMAQGETVRCPRVKAAPAALECKVTDIMQPTTLDGGKAAYAICFAEVTGVHIADEMIVDGRFDLAKADPIMRAGYHDYMAAGDLFELVRPG